MNLGRILMAAAVVMFSSATIAFAQSAPGITRATSQEFSFRAAAPPRISPDVVRGTPTRRASRQQTSSTKSRGASARKMAGALVGFLAGTYLGGEAGAAIEGNGCRCDDPGLKGRLIGMPVGAVFGTILGLQVR